MVYNFTYRSFRSSQTHRNRKQNGDGQGLGEGKEELVVHGEEFQSYKVESLRDCLHDHMNTVNITKLYM